MEQHDQDKEVIKVHVERWRQLLWRFLLIMDEDLAIDYVANIL
jgi:hypothetical protein